MNRQALLKALLAAKPSLGPTDGVLPMLSHFCFMDDILYAYSDVTATIVEIATGLTCALHGETLIGLLGVLGTDEVDIKLLNATTASINLGTGTAKVPMRGAEDFIFELPNEEAVATFVFDAAAIKAMEVCLQSVAKDSMKAEFNGVTITADAKTGIQMYSTNNVTASRAQLGKFVGRKVATAVLPVEACDQMLKLNAGSPDKFGTVQICERTAMVDYAAGVSMVTKLIPGKLQVFHNVFAGHADKATFFSLPPELLGEIQKALVVLSRNAIKEIELVFDKGTMTVTADGIMGKLKTKIGTAAPADFAAKVFINPEHVLRILPHVDEIAVNHERSLVFRGDGLTHLISSISRVQAPPEQQPDKIPKPNIEEDDIPF
jgi:hypothetical protein